PESQPYPGGGAGGQESGGFHGTAPVGQCRPHAFAAASWQLVRAGCFPPETSVVYPGETAGRVATPGAAGGTGGTGAAGFGPDEAAHRGAGQVHHGLRRVLVRARGRAAGDQGLAKGDIGQPGLGAGDGDGLLFSHGRDRLARPASGTAAGSSDVAAESDFPRGGPVDVLAGGPAVE